MCDCFHAVLPWPGAPGSVSAQQLEPQEPGAEEEHSVTAGPEDEVIRPRPQGSSPVYECRTEGTSFGLQEDAPGRRGASGRRRSWWKRDSGDSQTLSRMSRPEEATEVTLETEAEAGASGYSVTGGGHQGIFVKQVLKDSSAAKLFNLQAGDQLLSATVFFDDIKYEDALKILQYSEPYRVQFKVRRRLPAADAEGRGSSGSQRLAAGEEKQDKDIADGCPETPTKTLEGDGDQERLISQAREGRGRRPQKERRSWPKFQALKSTRGTGPRRSHSSSEAYERRDAPDVSPSSTDTEAQAPAEHLRQKAGPGPQRTRNFLNLRLRMGLGQEQPGRGVPEQSRPREDSRGDTGAAAGDGGERGVTLAPGARPVLSTPRPTQPGLPSLAEGEGSWSEGPGVGPKPQSGAKEVETQQEARTQAEGDGEAVQSLVSGTVRGPLQGTAQGGGAQSHPPEIRVRIPHLKMPKFGFCQEKELEIDRGASALQLAWGPSPGARGEGAREAGAGQDQGGPGPAWAEPGEDQGGGKGTVRTPEGEGPVTPRGKAPPRRERERESGVTGVTARTEVTPEREGRRHRIEDEPRSVSGMDGRAAAESLALALGDRDVAPQGGELQVPSFRVSAPGMTGQALVGPRLDAAVTLPVFQGHLETRHLSTELPSADLDVQQGQVDLKRPERQRPEAELREPQASAAGLRGHLPQVQIPSIKMRKVEPQGPQVDVKGPKVDVRGAEGDMEVSQPSMDVDIQACGGKLETDLVLGDKGLASKGSKFKMPKFKMPSFGASTPRKTVEVSVDKTMPVVEAAMTLPSLQGDLESRDLSTQLPSADRDIQSVQVDASHPEDQLPGVKVSEAQVAGTRLKGHLPKVQTPSIKMPKVGLRGPQVDIKGPNMEVKSTKGTVSTTVVEVSLPSVDADTQAPGAKVEPGLAMGDKEATMKDSKFRMPKFKMPSFGASTTRKTVQASMDVPTTTVGAAVTLPSSQGDLKAADLSLQLPSDPGVQPAQGDARLPEAQLRDRELSAPQASAAGPRGHLPKVPSIRMPKVELQGPQVDIEAPKVEVKGSMGEVGAPDLGVSLPSVDVDMQAPGAPLEMDLSLGDKDVTVKDGKFKLPKLKMPSFGTPTPGKTVEASVDVAAPKVEGDVTLASFRGELETTDLSIGVPSSDSGVQPAQGDVRLPDMELSAPQASAAGPRGHLPKVPSIRMPKVELQGPQVDIRAPRVDGKVSKGKVSTPDLEVSVPSVDTDVQALGASLEVDMAVRHEDVAAKDSKFRLPRFRMPSFGTSTTGKTTEAPLDVTAPKVEADLTLPAFQGEVKTTDLSVQLPSADWEVQPVQLDGKVPEVQQPEAELPTPQASAAGPRGHLPKVPVPSIRMPKVGLKGPKVDVRAPKVDVKGSMGDVGTPDLEVSLPSVDVDMQAPGVTMEADLDLGEKAVAARDSKFRLPRVKMPSFGVPTSGKIKEASVDMTTAKVEADVALTPFQGDLKTADLSLQLPSDPGVQPAQGDARLPEAQLRDRELSAPQASAAGPRGHLPKVPSIRMPKVELQGPQVDIEAPKVEVKGSMGEVGAPDLGVSLPSVDVDMQAPGAPLEMDLSLGDKDVTVKDGKFKLPKLKMPSFGTPTPGKTVEASVDVAAPKVEGDVTLASFRGELETTDLSIGVPSSDSGVQPAQGDARLPEAQLPDMELSAPQASAAGPRGHLPNVPSIRMPKVELQGPQVDIRAPRVDGKVSKGKVSTPDLEVSVPSVDTDVQAPGASLEVDMAVRHEDVAAKDSKFRLPRFRMPSFGTSTTGKTTEAPLDVTAPKVEADLTLPAFQGEVKTTDLSVQLPSADWEVQPVQLDGKVPEVQQPEAELPTPQASAAGPRGHLPKVPVPSIRMPKVGLKGPKVDVRAPKVDVKGSMGDVGTPDLEVSLPSVDVDMQAPGVTMEADLDLGEKAVAARDSKFRLPRVKMPSFGVPTSGKIKEASVDMTTAKVEADVALTPFQGDLKTADLSLQLPSDPGVQPAQGDARLPEAQLRDRELSAPQASAAGPRGHLPKVPSIRMPKVELQGPQVDIEAPKVEVKGSMGEVGAPDLGVSLPSVDVDMQAPGAPLEMDLSLGDKDVTVKDGKFKLPKLKMPSFGTPTPGKTVEASVDVAAPKVEGDVTLASFRGELETTDLSIGVPSSDSGVQPAQGDVRLPDMELSAPQASAAGPRGHLPKVPSIRMPKVELQGPQVDIRAPRVDGKVSKGKVSTPDLEVSVPSVDTDVQALGASLEVDMAVRHEDVAAKDSKFRLPRFRMPSFGTSTTGKTTEAPLDVTAPKVEADLTLPAFQGEVKTTDLSVQLPSADWEVQPVQLDGKVPEVQQPEAELPTPQASAAGPRGHLPKVPVPSIRMPKVGLKGPKVDVRAPKVDVKGSMGDVGTPDLEVSLPSVDVDMQAPGVTMEADLDLGEKAVAARDSKFRLPRVKMPSFGVPTSGKIKEASVDMTTAKVEADVALTPFQGDLKTADLSLQLPSDPGVQPAQGDARLPEAQLRDRELSAPQASAAGPRGHLPKVPSIRMPKVELQGPQVDIEAPKVEVKGSMGEVGAPDLGVSLPSVDVDMQAPGAPLEMDLSLGDKDVTVKDGKFKLPKLKMPSFGTPTPGKTVEASVDVAAPKVEGDVTLASFRGELETTDLSIGVPSSDSGVQPAQGDARLPEAQLPDMELSAPQASAAGPRGHLPNVPSIRMPKVELQGPQVDIRAPRVDGKVSKGKVSTPDLEVSVPSVDTDVQAPGASLEVDMAVRHEDVAAKDSKFRLPRFRMPSFGTSTTGKTTEAPLDVTAPKVEADLTLPAFQGEVKTTDLSVQLPSADWEVQPVQLDGKVPEVQQPEAELPTPQASAAGPRGHLPKVPVPSIRMPKVGLKGPKVDVRAPKVDVKGSMGDVGTPDLEVSLPSVDVDMQAPGVTMEADLDLGEKAVAARDSKFRLPRVKMPSFGVPTSGKIKEASVDMTTAKVEADVALTPFQGDLKTADLSLQLPSDPGVQPAQGDARLPEAQLRDRELSAPQASAAGPRGHLPKVPSIRMPKVELQGPQVDIEAPKVEVKGSMGEVGAPDLGVSLPSVDVDMQAPGAPLEMDLSLGDKDVTVKDGKFKLPKLKMPSFGTPTPGKTVEASVDVAAPKVEGDVTLASFRGELETTDLSIGVPSSDSGVQPAQGDVRLPDMELSAPQASAAGPRGHLPKVPSIRMPKVELQGPQVDIRAPRVDGKVSKGKVSTPDLEVSVPSVDTDVQAPGASLEVDMAVRHEDVAAKDSKFRLPRFRMPSFGTSTTGKTTEAPLDVTAPKVEADLTLPAFQGEVKTTDLSVQLPSADWEVQPVQLDGKVPEVQQPEAELPTPQASAAGPRGHLPKVPVPSIRMPKVGLKGPKVDVRAPKVDVKGSMGDVGTPDLEVSLPSVDVDMQAPGVTMEADLDLGEKAVAARDSKFRLPRVKMPSFGVPTSGKIKEASVDMTTAKVEADVALTPFQGDLKTADLSLQLPSDPGVQPAQGDARLPEAQLRDRELSAPQASAAGPRGHLPKVPSIRMPKVELQGPQVDIEAPKVEVKGSMGEVGAPDLGVSLPSVDVDMQAPGAPLEMDLSLGHKDVTIKDSKFKMPKFKMPSFGTSTPGKTVEASLDKTVLMVESDLNVLSFQGDLRTTDLSIQLPSSDPEVQPSQMSVMLPEGPQPETELPPPQASEAGLKEHLPNVPSIKAPKVELTGSQVDIKSPSEVAECSKGEVSAPEMEVSLPCTDLGIRAPGVKGTSFGDKEVTVKDSKFRMPKFKMPSFGVSTPRKTVEASVDVPTTTVEAAVALPPHCGDLRSIELSRRLPSAVQPGQLCVEPPEGQLPGAEMSEQPRASGLRGPLPGAQMPSIKVPRVDLKGPQVAIMGLEVDMKGAKEEVSTPDLEASLPTADVGIQAPGVKVETDLALGNLSPPPPSSSRGPVSSSSLEGSLEYIDEAPSAAGSPGAGAGDFQGSAALPEARVSVQAETRALGSAAQDSASAPGGSSERLPGPGHGPFPPVPPSALATSSVVHTAQAPGQVPQRALPSAPLASVDVTGGHVSTSRKHVRLTEYQVTLPLATLAPPPPQDVAFGSQVSAPFPSLGSSAAPQCPGCVPTSQTAGLLPAAHGRVTFPKFHKPKFGFSTPKATVPEVDLRAEVHAPALPAGDPTGAMGDVAEKGGPSSLPGSELRSSGVSASLETATKAPKGAPSEASDQEGKGSPFRAPGRTLPSQSRALGQDRGPTGDPEGSWEGSDAEHPDAQPKGPGSHVDTHEHRPPEVQGEKSRRGLSTAEASAGQAGVALLSPAATGGVGAAERASSSGAKSGPSGEGAVSRRLPQARFPSLGLVRLDRRSSKATAEVSQAEARLRLPAHTAAAGSGIGGPTEDGTAPPGEDLPQPPCGKPDAGLPGEDAPAGATPVSAQESWFKMPKLHMPGSRRTRSKDRGEAGEQEAPGEEGSPLSGPEAQAGAALQPPDTRAEAAAASEGLSSMGVWQCPPHSTGVTLSEISTQPAEGSLPLQGLGTRPSGRQAEALVESWPSPPQGPVRLTASRTDVPAQVSMVSTDQLWEDSVLTVQFPKLKGPRFSFPAPGSEADVFIPAVQQVWGSVAGAGEALSEGRPGLWAASILPAATEVFGEQPVCLDPSSGPPPISQVRVHFQRVPAESQDIVLRHGASPVPADPVETEAISTQIVRESEIPTSRVQTPSYGFSLLKVKIPEPRSRAACTVPGGSEDPAAGDCGASPPDSAEPSEVVPPGGHPLGPAEDEEPGGHPLGPAEDEEPAQVLEFPAEEGRAAAGAGAAPQRPGGQKSGLWFWLPHIGFSSSAGEASAASRDLSRRPAPVQTQPEAGPAAHLPGRQEKASRFRFPKLGFSAPPAKSGPGVEGGAGPSEPTSQDETVAYFDARESLSPEEKEGADAAEAAGAGQKELTKNAGREPAPPTQRGLEKGEA